jgi:hypothetical protein
MARTTQDVALITGILMGGKDFSSYLKGSWEGLGIGFVDPELWQAASFVTEPNEDFKKQTVRAILRAEEVYVELIQPSLLRCQRLRTRSRPREGELYKMCL